MPPWVTASSSVFLIDQAVYDFAPEKSWFSRLKDLSDKGQAHPFPTSPGRNFNVLGAGWSWEKGNYVEGSEWVASHNMSVDHMPEVMEQLQRFITKNEGRATSPHWCRDVPVLMKFLELCKVTHDKRPKRTATGNSIHSYV